MTPRPDTDATRGVCARPLAKRAVSLVDTRTRRHDPFAARPSVGQTLRFARSRDPDTTPRAAIHHALRNEWLVACPRPNTGRPCLTVRDARRVAACHNRYRVAEERQNVRACRDLLDSGLPGVLDMEGVVGP